MNKVDLYTGVNCNTGVNNWNVTLKENILKVSFSTMKYLNDAAFNKVKP